MENLILYRKNTAKVLSKFENVLFVPCLVMGTFIENFRLDKLASSAKIFAVSTVIVLISIVITTIFSKIITKDTYERNIYTYGLTFANFGFMGNAVVSALFPDVFLDYIIFTMPGRIAIYVWAVPNLLIGGDENQTFKDRIKALLNPMFVAMLLTGVTVSFINVKETFADAKIYIASIIRLILIPLAFLGINHLIGLEKTFLVCALCFVSMPLGLNTIVIPSAYGKDTSKAAGMALISHFDLA